MKEWNTKYNSFNSYKVFKHIEKWSSVVNDDRIDPPVFLSIDPNSGCNLKCKPKKSPSFRWGMNLAK